MLSVVMLSVVMLNFVMLNVVMLDVTMLSAVEFWGQSYERLTLVLNVRNKTKLP